MKKIMYSSGFCKNPNLYKSFEMFVIWVRINKWLSSGKTVHLGVIFAEIKILALQNYLWKKRIWNIKN